MPVEGKEQGVKGGRRTAPSSPQHADHRSQHYLENGSDFPTGNPLPCVLVSTLPQCTAT